MGPNVVAKSWKTTTSRGSAKRNSIDDSVAHGSDCGENALRIANGEKAFSCSILSFSGMNPRADEGAKTTAPRA
jgi:hypothetical protein